MALNDKFRIDELMKKGSKAVRRNPNGDIVVRKIDGKEVRNIQKKKEVPFGLKPIKGKQITEKLKSDFVEIPDEINPQQESFGGETSLYVEKPIYNEEELRKAIDIRVDELIKKKKPVRDEYVRKKLYDDLRKQLREKGLLSTLKTLQQNFEGNEDAAAQVFGNIRALSGVLDLMGANAEGTAKIFDALTESVGATNTAFEVAGESVSKKLDKALAKLSNSTIPPAKNALLGIVNATNGIISAFEILGDVGGPSGDLKRQIDANKKSLDEFAISGKEAAKEYEEDGREECPLAISVYKVSGTKGHYGTKSKFS